MATRSSSGDVGDPGFDQFNLEDLGILLLGPRADVTALVAASRNRERVADTVSS